WREEGGFRWPELQDLGRELRSLSSEHAGRVRVVERVGRFEIWEVDLPLALLLPRVNAPAFAATSPAESSSRVSPPRPGGQQRAPAGGQSPRPRHARYLDAPGPARSSRGDRAWRT